MFVVFVLIIQTIFDFSFHYRECLTFSENIEELSLDIASNLDFAVQNINDSENCIAALTGANLYTKDIEKSLYRPPQYNILWFKFKFLPDSSTPSFFLVIPRIQSELDDILKEYTEKNTLSSDSIASLLNIQKSFEELNNNLSSSRLHSRKAFTQAIETFCSNY